MNNQDELSDKDLEQVTAGLAKYILQKAVINEYMNRR